MPKHLLALFALLLAALACATPSPGSPTAESAALPDIADLVAATLTAVASAPGSEPPATPQAPSAPPSLLTIAYAREGNLLLWREGQGSQPVTTASAQPNTLPRLSDDGQMIAFARGNELYSIRADGTDERLLVGQDYLTPFLTDDITALSIKDFKFHPNSHELFFSLFAETDFFSYPLNDLHFVDAEGGPPRLMLPAREGGPWSFSPDGQHFALVQGDRIQALERDGGNVRTVLNFTFVSTYSEWTYYPEVIWRDDSAGFYTVIPASAALDNPAEPSRYYYVSLDGSSPSQLAEFVAVPVWHSFPPLAPNGQSVAYVQEASGQQALHVIGAQAADRTLLTQDALVLLNWNPDNQSVAYYHPDRPGEIYLQPPTGGPLLLNTTGGPALGLRWVSETRYLFISAENLLLCELPANCQTLDSAVKDYDFVLAP